MTDMFSRRSLGLLLLVMASFASPASAGILWYNGDYDNRDSAANETKVLLHVGTVQVTQNSLVYDNFTVPVGQVWTISSVYSDNQMAYGATPTTATWQIRSGVSAGNGGKIEASGDSAATQTALTPVGGYYYGDPEYRITATITPVVLTAGTYWLAVSPDSTQQYYNDQSYIETTSGANSVGTPRGNDGNSFITNTYPASGTGSYNFTPTAIALAGNGDGSTIDFSMGVSGTSAVVPEPASVAMVAAGLLGSLVWARKRRTAVGPLIEFGSAATKGPRRPSSGPRHPMPLD